MGKPEAYKIDGDTKSEPVNLDSMRRETSKKATIAGPELLSIVRIGNDDVHWIVVSVSVDRRSVSVAPLKQGAKVGMKHGVSVSELWPYYGQLEKSAQSATA
jgi:hypothetical protein